MAKEKALEKRENPVATALTEAIANVKENIDVSTIIGEPVYTESGLTIIPVSKVTYGFATGGSDFPSTGNKELFGGSGGCGVTITPTAFLLIQNGQVSIKHMNAYDNAAERVVNLVPDMFDKVSNLVTKKKDDIVGSDKIVEK
ncbi:MAG: sporulation protein YtfJ [Clostridia bacterium]|nr:sporulation protein YtfJ [Clostridia bacterium]